MITIYYVGLLRHGTETLVDCGAYEDMMEGVTSHEELLKRQVDTGHIVGYEYIGDSVYLIIDDIRTDRVYESINEDAINEIRKSLELGSV